LPYSMTGFATHELEASPFRFIWEIRSVNHRFLDLSIRVPEEMRALEARCRELITARIKRGKVDCSLRWSGESGQARGLGLAEDALTQLLSLAAEVSGRYPAAQPLTVAEILRWPGVLAEPRPDFEAIAEPVIEGLEGALTALQQARQREGDRIDAFLRERADSVVALLDAIRPRLEDVQQRYRQKLQDRLARLEIEATPERFEQEVGIVTQRLDVAEEVDRLLGHVNELRHVLGTGEPVGRRLDFLIQELNREANTFASKVQDEALTRGGVDLKVLIEQMREQVQNLE
jgi:uncharacterized protein (TIGR00255 family)